MAELVTLDQAKHHLRISGTHEDPDVQMKLEQAQALVLDYISQRLPFADPSEEPLESWPDTVASWTADTAPKQIQAAILIQVGELYRFRGDDEMGSQPEREHGFLHPSVVAYLHRQRDPAIA